MSEYFSDLGFAAGYGVAAAYAAQVQPASGKVQVTTFLGFARQDPNTSSTSNFMVYLNEVLDQVAMTTDKAWVQIQKGDKYGWVKTTDVRVISNAPAPVSQPSSMGPEQQGVTYPPTPTNWSTTPIVGEITKPKRTQKAGVDWIMPVVVVGAALLMMAGGKKKR